MKYHLRHETVYRYAQDVSISHHLARLRPLTGGGQRVEEFLLQVQPTPSSRHERTDYFGNKIDYFTIHELHNELRVVTESKIEVLGSSPATMDSPAWEEVRDEVRRSRSSANLQAYQFVFPSDHVPCSDKLAAYALESFPAGRPLLTGALELTERVFRDFVFDPTATTISTPVEEVLLNRRGVCQDFAHLQIACLRSIGLPAAYFSGYVRTEPPPGQPRLQGADATHAWLAVYSPGLGWTEFDPTNNLVPGDSHIHVARGRDFADVSPLRGTVVGGGQQKLSIGVTMESLPEERDGET